MGLYEVPLSMSLLGFGMGAMLAKFHIMYIVFVDFNKSIQKKIIKICVVLCWC